MANHASSKKRARQTPRKTAVNKNRLSRIRTYIKKVEKALADNDTDLAQEALKQAQPQIDRGVAKGILKKNAAARKMSRLSSRIKKVKAA